jgi:hypothetical protein
MRDEAILIRLSKEEKEILQNHVNGSGIPLSVWIRSEALRLAKQK